MINLRNNAVNVEDLTTTLELCITAALAVGFIAWQIELNAVQVVVLTGIAAACGSWHLLFLGATPKSRLCSIAGLVALVVTFLAVSLGMAAAMAAAVGFCVSTAAVNLLAAFTVATTVKPEDLSSEC